MRSIATVLVVVCTAATSAHADGPIVIRAGFGLTRDLGIHDFRGAGAQSTTHPSGPGVHIEMGYRIHEYVAAGVHVGVTRNSESVELGDAGLGFSRFDNVYWPVQLGLGAQFSISRVWASAWAGINDGADNDKERRFALGLGLGVDLYIAPSGHRFGIYFDGAYSPPEDNPIGDDGPGNRYVSGGVAYRYW
jgi:hypothetical protein